MPRSGLPIQMDSSEHNRLPFIKEPRLHNIKNHSRSGRFPQSYFIPCHNKRFAKTAGAESAFKPLPLKTNLGLIFCKKYQRKVNLDNTVQIQVSVVRIPPLFCQIVADVCLPENNNIHTLLKNRLIHSAKLSKNNKFYRLKNKPKLF